MANFRVSTKDNTCNQIFLQGARAHNNSNDIASIIFQNYDADSSNVYNMAAISMIDVFGNTLCNGMGALTFKTNVDGCNLTEKMRIDNYGNVLIGSSCSNGYNSNNPKGNLYISGSLQTANIVLPYTTSNPAPISSNLVLFANSNGVSVMKPDNTTILLGQGSGTSNGAIADVLNLGSNYYVETDALSLTVSSDLQNKLTLTTPVLGAGTYRLDTSFQIFNSTEITNSIRVQGNLNSSVWLDTIMNCSPSYVYNVGSNAMPVGSGTYSDFLIFSTVSTSNILASLNFASPTGNFVGIKTARLNLSQIVSYADYYLESETLSLSTNSNLQEKLVLTTPALTPGQYRIDISYQVYNASTVLGSSPIQIACDVNGQTWLSDIVNCPLINNASALYTFTDFTMYNLPARQMQGSNSILPVNIIASLRFASPSGNMVGIKTARINISQIL